MLVIISRPRAAEYESVVSEFKEIPGCQVILDRRLGERRRRRHDWGAEERRRRERRTGLLLGPDEPAVVFVC